MSWNIISPATQNDSPSTEFGKWLQLSPASLNSSPLRDITHNARVNKVPSKVAYQGIEMALSGSTFSPDCSDLRVLTSSASLNSSISSSSQPLVPGYKETMLFESAPSPIHYRQGYEGSIKSRPSSRIPSPFSSDAFPESLTYRSQDSFGSLDEAPLATILAFEEDNQPRSPSISPIIRSSQSQTEMDVTSADGRAMTRVDSQRSTTASFTEMLLSRKNLAEERTSPSKHVSAPPALLSPCKLLSLPPRDRLRTRAPSRATSVSLALDAFPVMHNTNITPPRSQILSPLSPLSPIEDGSDSDGSPPNLASLTLLKRKISQREASLPPSKRSRRLAKLPATSVDNTFSCSKFASPSLSSAPTKPWTSASASASAPVPSPSFTTRTLPPSVVFSSKFPLFYRRFPASSYFQPKDVNSPCTLFKVPHPGGNYNPPRFALDLYTPRFVKHTGAAKVGLCPICVEPPSRGGEGKKLWLAMKFSAFKCYHMQYAHGISASTGKPFSPPISFKVVRRAKVGKGERDSIQHGKCHKCHKWIAVDGVKDAEVKVPEMFWWKHAAACHQKSKLDGECGFHENDDIYRRLVSL